MKSISLPIFKTLVPNSPEFDLSNPSDRQKYFELKAGTELAQLREYLLNGNTFIAFMMGKKGAGKGTYSKLFMDALGPEAATKLSHVAIGDIVRDVHHSVEEPEKQKELLEYLKKNYRGEISPEEAIERLLGRSTSTLLPTDFILALAKREIDKLGHKAIFLDGFPRTMDQVSYSLYFRQLINYRDDPDFFVLIDIPESVIDARIKTRVVCPKCHTSRNLNFNPTKKVGFDADKSAYYLICDNPECDNAKMLAKEGDELGIEAIRDRLETDEQLIVRAFSLHGVPKVLLRNTIPIDQAKDYANNYELTPEYVFEVDPVTKEVKVSQKPWVVEDDEKVPSYSLTAAAVTVSMIKQIPDILGL